MSSDPSSLHLSRAPRGVLLWWLAGAIALFHIATASGYGYFRDELYFLACGEHLAFGYVDHPPLIALVAAGVRGVLGQSLFALRLLPALAAGATVWVTGAVTAELGGRRFAQALAMTCVALAPVILSLCTYLSKNAFDLLIWAVAWWLFVRLLEQETTPRWLALGAVLGVGLENKILVLCLGLGITVGMLTHRPAAFRTRGPWLAGMLALLLFAPYLGWQILHDWPTLEFMERARAHKMLELAPLDWLSEQALQMGPFSLPVWLTGLVYLLTSERARAQRPLAIAFLTVLAVLLFSHGKGYYAAPAYLPLFAAGGVALERLPLFQSSRLRAALLTVLVLGGALSAPLAKPILPVETFVHYQASLGLSPGSSGERHEQGVLPQFFADMHGWQDLTATVARVYNSLPAQERSAACVFGENYGQAGAIDFFGPAYGLPPALATHNNYFLWGPRGCTGELMIVIGGERETLEREFERAELAATFHCSLCRPDEDDKPIWIVRNARVALDVMWPDMKHYD